MSNRQRALLAVVAVILCVGATQYAMRGRHEPTGNVGYLGTEIAAVEGIGGSGTEGYLGAPESGVRGVSNASLIPAIFGRNEPTQSFGYIGYNIAGGYFGANSIDGVGVSATGARGVFGLGLSSTAGEAGVRGDGPETGVYGRATATTISATGVYGTTPNGYGIRGDATAGTGVYGYLSPGGAGHAGYFSGRVTVVGTFTNTMSSSRIDHPADPAGKYLTHSSVESSERLNVYSGKIELGPDGTAIVELPEWFEALNEDFRYQLTCIGEHAPVYIAEEIKENRFRIAGGFAGMKISWQVSGVRHDPYAKAHPLVVEEIKPVHEFGRFLHPELYGQPPVLRVEPNADRK